MTENPQDYPYSISRLALAFSPLRPARYAALVASILQFGLRHPIVVWRGEIIDGVHRLKACIEAGVEPRFEHLADEADPIEFLMTEAITFRDMDDNGRAVAAYQLSQWSTRGRPRAEDENCANLRIFTQGDAAGLFGVSLRLVSYAAQVLAEESPAVPSLRQAVTEWKIKASAAAGVVSRPAEVQERVVELVTGGQARTVKAAVERVEREIAEVEAAATLAGMLATPLDETVTQYVAKVADLLQLVPASSVDAIIAHPPHAEDRLSMYSDLAAFAAHALKPSGFMAVVGSGMLLPQMLRRLEHEELGWIMELDLHNGGPPARSGRPYFLDLHRMPVLIYGKAEFRPAGWDDLIEGTTMDELPPGLDRNETAMQLIVRKLCRPGQTVCDPIMVDRAGAALAARRMGCTFIGATERAHSRDRILARLVRSCSE